MTVLTAMKRSWAICWLDAPSATRCRTCSSRSLRGSTNDEGRRGSIRPWSFVFPRAFKLGQETRNVRRGDAAPGRHAQQPGHGRTFVQEETKIALRLGQGEGLLQRSKRPVGADHITADVKADGSSRGAKLRARCWVMIRSRLTMIWKLPASRAACSALRSDSSAESSASTLCQTLVSAVPGWPGSQPDGTSCRPAPGTTAVQEDDTVRAPTRTRLVRARMVTRRTRFMSILRAGLG